MRIARFLCLLFLFLAVGSLAIPVPSRAQVAVGISVRIGPPVLPIYVQPICPGPGYIWIPGYWAYGPDGYFWVPGTWVFPPEVGLLWTPGYWDWDDGLYIWHEGYWGPEVGFYGGVAYGFGYPGVGFYGGYWQDGAYYYNRSVTNVDVTIVRNTYNTTVVNNNNTTTRVSFHGGQGGTTLQPTQRELQAANQHHASMTSVQMQHQEAARSDRALLASVNHGRPDVAASPRPGEFHGRGPLTKGVEANPKQSPGNRDEIKRPGKPEKMSRPDTNDRPPSLRPSEVSPVNPKLEQKQQKELEKMRQQQDAERQKMEGQHNQERQKLEQGRANQQRQDEVQRRQQQQADQMQRKHDQQSQKLQERQQKEQRKEQQRPQQKPQQKPPRDGKP
jgi:YXWGXW repeat-containing protein